MHIDSNKVNVISKLTICILILLVLICTTSFAQDYILQEAGTNANVTRQIDDEIFFTRNNIDGELQVTFSPSQTGLYGVVVALDSDYRVGRVKECRVQFKIDRVASKQMSSDASFINVSCAAKKKGNEISVCRQEMFTSDSGGEVAYNNAVNVILDKDSTYTLRILDNKGGNTHYLAAIRKLEEEDGATYGFASNFPSAWITMGSKVVLDSNDPQLSGYPKMTVTTDKISDLLKALKVDTDNSSENSFEWLESILVYIIFAIGNVIVHLFELALGIKGITLDNIIFNKMANSVNNPTIDLRPLGGIPIGSDVPVDGILLNSNVVDVVGSVFTGLKNIVLIFYIILLLYVGLKMLMSIGTPKESSSKKFLQYWLTGIIILIALPYFLPAIPFISNELTKTISENAKKNSTYSLQEIASKLGDKFRGEDAEVIAMVDELEKRIERAQAALGDGSTKLTAEEAREKIIKEMNIRMTTTMAGLTDEEKDEFQAKVLNVADKIYNNIDNWNNSNYKKNNYENDVYDIRDYIYERHNTVKGFSNVPPESGTSNSYYSLATRDWLKLNTITDLSDSDRNYIEDKLRKIAIVLQDKRAFDRKTGNIDQGFIFYNDYTGSIHDIESILRKYLPGDEAVSRANTLKNQLNSGSFFKNFFNNTYKSMHTTFENYITALLQEEIQTYEDMLASLDDPMVKLYKMAKEQSRVIYAIAWAILMFQVIAILFMYYKRVFVVLLLVVLFPIVMALYVVDKLGDGQAQSFQNWFKEFFVNCMIQFLHALVYVLVVNLGIDICNMDPTRNWFFLIIAVTSLFPIERMLRSIVGLNSTTVGGLKNNIMGLVVAGAAVAKTGKNVFNMGANAATKGVSFGKDIAQQHKDGKSYGSIAKEKLSEGKKKVMEAMKAPAEQVNAKRDKKSQMRQSRSDNRAYRLQASNDAKAAIKGGVGTFGDRVDIARGAVANVTGKVSNTLSKVRNSRIGKVGASLHMAGAYGGKALKMTAGGFKKLGGTAAGIVTGMEAAADSAVANGEGFAAGIATGRKAVHEFGGYQDHKRLKNGPEKPTSSNFANSYASRSGAGGADALSAPSDGGILDVTTPGGDGISSEELAVGTVAAVGTAAVVGSALARDSEEENTAATDNNAQVNADAAQAEEPAEDKNIDVVVENNIERTVDEEGNVLGVEGDSTTTATTENIDVDAPEVPDISVQNEVSVDADGGVQVDTNAGVDMNGQGTVSSETKNDDGNISSETVDL